MWSCADELRKRDSRGKGRKAGAKQEKFRGKDVAGDGFIR